MTNFEKLVLRALGILLAHIFYQSDEREVIKLLQDIRDEQRKSE